jgi:hypothetical protein
VHQQNQTNVLLLRIKLFIGLWILDKKNHLQVNLLTMASTNYVYMIFISSILLSKKIRGVGGW